MKRYPTAFEFVTVLSVLSMVLATCRICRADDGGRECSPGFWVVFQSSPCGICCRWNPPGDVTGECEDVDCAASGFYSEWLPGICVSGQGSCTEGQRACTKPLLKGGCGINDGSCACQWIQTDQRATQCHNCP